MWSSYWRGPTLFWSWSGQRRNIVIRWALHQIHYFHWIVLLVYYTGPVNCFPWKNNNSLLTMTRNVTGEEANKFSTLRFLTYSSSGTMAKNQRNIGGKTGTLSCPRSKCISMRIIFHWKHCRQPLAAEVATEFPLWINISEILGIFETSEKPKLQSRIW